MGTSKYDEDKQITWEDFLGNEEKELELLIHIDSSRQARRMVADSECKKTRFKDAQEWYA